MALTADIARPSRGFTYHNPEVQATAQIYAGSYVAVGGENHATAAKIGRAYPFNDEAGAIPMGFAQQNVLGAAAAGPLKTADVYVRGRVIESLAVTGLAGDYTDGYKLVYASDDGTFTLTRTALNMPVGIIVNHHSSTVCDVYFYSFAELTILSLSGGTTRQWPILTTTYEFAATGNILIGAVAPCNGRIISVDAWCVAAPDDVNVEGTVNLEIDGTNVTGGVVSYDHTDTIGLKLAGTAVTAENVFLRNSLIDVEATVTAAGTVGDGMLQLVITYDTLLGL